MSIVYAKLILILVLAAAGFSCSVLQPITDNEKASGKPLAGTHLHRRVVILPFLNSAAQEGIEQLVRTSFYHHFSSKNYYDIEVMEVDRSVQLLEEQYGKQWRQIPARQLGKFFHADFLVYGEVLDFKKLYLLFYSQIALSVKASMVSTGSGTVVWQDTAVRRLHSGDLPLHPLSLMPAAVRSGLNIAEERKMDLIERTCRALVVTMPDAGPKPPGQYQADIQLASFNEKSHAYQVLRELQERGYRPRIEQVRLQDKLWYRVLLGPYSTGDAEKLQQQFTADDRFRPILIYHSRIFRQ
jgi:hypothetical protein